jgi:hypothetical protein
MVNAAEATEIQENQEVKDLPTVRFFYKGEEVRTPRTCFLCPLTAHFPVSFLDH